MIKTIVVMMVLAYFAFGDSVKGKIEYVMYDSGNDEAIIKLNYIHSGDVTVDSLYYVKVGMSSVSNDVEVNRILSMAINAYNTDQNVYFKFYSTKYIKQIRTYK